MEKNLKTIHKAIKMDDELSDWCMSEAKKLGLSFGAYVRMMLMQEKNRMEKNKNKDLII